MDENTRDLINRLGNEVAGILENVSTDAALLPRVPVEMLSAAIESLERSIENARALAAAMRVFAPQTLDPAN